MSIAEAGSRFLTARLAAVFLVAVAPWITTEAGAQSLPAGWRVIDIGKPPSAGSATVASPTLTVTSSGYDVNGTRDQFTFAYTPLRGDVTIVARLTALPTVDSWAQAGLMIRDGAGAAARSVFAFGTPGGRTHARHRANKGGATGQTSGGAAALPVWLKLERRSSTFTASRSSNGVSWITIGSFAVSMSSGVLVGVAAASHSKTGAVAATFDRISVNGQSWPAEAANNPPAVSLTSPANGASLLAPATVALAATATDSDGTIAKVDFYNGSVLVGSDATNPYSFSWTGVAAGTYVVKAIATDDKGASTTSTTATITVGTNVSPTVSMTSPANGASFVAPTSITLSAAASDSDGGVQKVEFFIGTTLVGTDTTSPYAVTWPAPVGSHSVSAVATDNLGASTVSAWRDIVVTAAAVPGTAIFRPASPSDAVDYYVFEVFAEGANPNVANPIAVQNIGIPPVVSGESSADIRATVLALAPGNYIATVAGIGSEGVLRSNTFAFTR